MQPVTVQAVQQRMRLLHKILRNPESPAYITMKAYYEGALTGVSEPLKKRDRWAENKVLLPQVLAGDISRMCGVLNESLLGVRGVSTGDDLRTLTECAKRPVAWQDAVKVAVGVAYVEWEEKEQARYLKRHDQRCEGFMSGGESSEDESREGEAVQQGRGHGRGGEHHYVVIHESEVESQQEREYFKYTNMGFIDTETGETYKIVEVVKIAAKRKNRSNNGIKGGCIFKYYDTELYPDKYLIRDKDYEYTPCDEWIADNTYFRMDIDYF